MNIPATQLLLLMHKDGGFRSSPNGVVRPDSTAWASLILGITHPTLIARKGSLDILAAFQLEDGRVSLSPEHSEASWPTSLAALAWQHSPRHQANHNRAIQFLLGSSGKHWEKKSNSVLAHNPALKGWAWIDNTHSWVESTALAIITLHNAGYGTHPRVHEATNMLLDRQLSHGGWNYGNTRVFGTELHPSPEDTGAALSALFGRVSISKISHSLEYLIKECTRLRTPISLGWSLLGLNAWGETPPQAEEWIQETLARSDRFGGYDTSSLCLLIAPLVAPHGLQALERTTQAFINTSDMIMGTV